MPFCIQNEGNSDSRKQIWQKVFVASGIEEYELIGRFVNVALAIFSSIVVFWAVEDINAVEVDKFRQDLLELFFCFVLEI